PLDTERNGAAGDDDGRAALGNGRQIVAEARELLSVQRWGACFPGRPREHRRADLDHRPSAARERGAEGVGHQARLSKCSKDARQLVLPDIGRARAGHARLRGLRLVHTHLKDEPLTRDDLTDLVLLRLDAVAAIVAREDGLPGKIYVATLMPWNTSGDLYNLAEAPSLYELEFDAQAKIAALEQEMARVAPVRAVGVAGRAILVGVHTGDRAAAEASLQELQELARTADVQVLDVVL